MDLETENRVAAILMREAAELRRQAEKEGTLAYLRQPNVRNRPNSRFLTATVLGVQQANRAVEVKEMWQVRQKELELDRRLKRPLREEANCDRSHKDGDRSGSSRRHPVVNTSISASASCSDTREYEHCPEGLRDEELEDFLHSKIKRGRGAVGPRMDETGPYLPPSPDGESTASPNARERRVVYGPERPPSLKSDESSEDEFHKRREKKAKKSHSGKSDKEYPRKQRSKEKSKHKKKKREEKRSKRGH
ncbi:protein FAM133 [Senna tora]|uniref:Protein FAM133 n=1 Tax=Senna tora TaxID=362788 RepID=A0A834XD32_9FABA|nr:protein FAM133 [Senna tora]